MIFLFIIVVVTLALINGKSPTLPNALEKSRFYQSKLDPTNKLTFSTTQNKKYKGFKDLLDKKKTVNNITGNKVSAPLIRSGFYTPWSPTALPDLKSMQIN